MMSYQACTRPYPLLRVRLVDIEKQMPPEPCLFEFYLHICSLDADRKEHPQQRQFTAYDYILHRNEQPVMVSFVYWEIDHSCCSLQLVNAQQDSQPYRVIGRYRSMHGDIQCFSIERMNLDDIAALNQHKAAVFTIISDL